MAGSDFAIIGAGLAGCECALVLAAHGLSSTLYEQKPLFYSPAHKSPGLAELVCSNSLRSGERTSGIGLLKNEMRQLGSFFMKAADACKIPADAALAVDRVQFSSEVENMVRASPLIRLVSKRIDSLGDPELAANGEKGIIIAAGPLISARLADSLAEFCDQENLHFYDAIAPIVWTDSLNMNVVFRASRHNRTEQGDYLNCPMSRDEYVSFYDALIQAETCAAHFEEKHFEGCMPIEALAKRGFKTLAFGPLKPVGLLDPRSGQKPWAVLQLRAENKNMDTCNLVGCQTKLLQKEQGRIFRMIPGLENAEFARYGSMHRNTYLNAPKTLNRKLELRKKPGIFVTGQLTGVEGYVESAASALWLALLMVSRVKGKDLPPPPPETALGSLLAHLQTEVKNFQPSNANFGLMPALSERVPKRERREKYAARAEAAFKQWQENIGM